MEKQIRWNVSKADHRIIECIVDRALAVFPAFERQATTMDITAVHLNGCPLRLAALLEADDFDFSHDILGIRQHLDRATGLLTDGFSPRFARPHRAESHDNIQIMSLALAAAVIAAKQLRLPRKQFIRLATIGWDGFTTPATPGRGETAERTNPK